MADFRSRSSNRNRSPWDPVHEVGRDADAREIQNTSSSSSSRRGSWFSPIYLLLFANLVILGIIAIAIIVGFVLVATKHHEMSVMYEVVMRADQVLTAGQDAGATFSSSVGSRYNVTAMLEHLFPAQQEDLERNIWTISSGARDFMGLISEVRGSDAIERYARLAYSLEKIVGNEEVQKSLPRILRTVADGLENTDKEDVRSFIEAMDISEVRGIMDVGNEMLGKLQSIVASLLRSRADQGMIYAMQRLVELAQDEEFRGMMVETPVFFHHLVEIVQSDDFKLIMSSGAQAMDRAETILDKAKKADLVSRSDRILTKVDTVMDKLIDVADAVQEDGITIQVGNHHPKVRALPSP